MTSRCAILISIFVLFASADSLPAQAPVTSAPTTAPQVEQLDGGRVRFVPPEGWVMTKKGEDGKFAHYATADRVGQVSLNVMPQQDAIQADQAKRLGMQMGQKIRGDAQQSGTELLYGPRVEADDRFFLKLRTRMKVPERGTVDETHLFRVMGGSLFYANVTSDTDSEETARRNLEAVERMMSTARLAQGPRPFSYIRTRVKVVAPADWKEQRSDNPNGLVATFREPNDGPGRLILRSKVVPKAARDDAAAREKLLDAMAEAEGKTPPVPGLTPAGEPQVTPASGEVLRTVTRRYDGGGQGWNATARYRAVGDVLLSVTALAPDAGGAFETIDPLGEQMITSAEPLDKPAKP